MASGTIRPDGAQWVFFRAGGKRHTLRFGKISTAKRLQIQDRLQRLIDTAAAAVELDADLLRWVGGLSDAHHATLSRAGLVLPRMSYNVGDLIETHIAGVRQRGGARSTVDHLCVVGRIVLDFFGDGCRVDSVTAEQIDAFHRHLATRPRQGGGVCSRSTVALRIRRTKEFFQTAVVFGWIKTNPAAHVKNRSYRDATRDVYISGDEWLEIIDAAPTAEMKMFLAMARGLGVRVPSELVGLRWDAFLWDLGLVRIDHPKTPESPQHEIPIFDGVWDYVAAAWDAARVGEVFCFPSLQGITGTAIRNRVEVLYRRIGRPLPAKLWPNVRASCSRDLLQTVSVDEAAAVLNHSPATMLKFYSRYRQFRREAPRALHWPTFTAERSAKRSAVEARSDSDRHQNGENTPVLTRWDPLTPAAMLPEGLEPSGKNPTNKGKRGRGPKR